MYSDIIKLRERNLFGMKNKKVLINIVKLIFAISFGGFLGVKLLVPGDPLMILLFFVICGIGGVVLSKIEI